MVNKFTQNAGRLLYVTYIHVCRLMKLLELLVLCITCRISCQGKTILKFIIHTWFPCDRNFVTIDKLTKFSF